MKNLLKFWKRKINMKGWKIFKKKKMKNTCLITLVAKQCIKLWDWLIRVKDTSCKATYKISDLSVINSLIMHVNNYKMESYCLKCKKIQKT